MADIVRLLGKDAESLLQHRCITTPVDQLYLLGADYVDRTMVDNNRPPAVLRNIQTLYNIGCLGGAGYPSTPPVNQGVGHSVGASFAVNPLYFNLKNIVGLAIEAGCNCMVSTYGALASVSRRYVHRILFLVRLNHDETLSYPTEYDQTLYVNAEQASNTGIVVVGATIYFGSGQSCRQTGKVSVAFKRAHELGLVTVLWAYLHNSALKEDGVGYHVSTDLTGRANRLVAAIGADTVKQEMAENNGGYKAINFGYTDGRVYSGLISDNSIDLIHYQLVNCCMGRAGLINSGDTTGGETDPADTVRIAVVNKHTDGMGPVPGCKAFKGSMADGVKLVNAMQDVYPNGKAAIA